MVNTLILNTKQLLEEYNIIFKQYEELYKNLANLMQSNNNDFVTLKGLTWWSNNPLKEIQSDTVENCITVCATDAKCSGATYDTQTKFCWLSSGEGNIELGNDNYYALISNIRAHLLLLENLNNKLLLLNKQIIYNLDKINEDIVDKNVNEELYNDNTELLNEKTSINLLLEKYNNVDSKLENKELYVNQSHMSLKLWSVIAFMLVLLTINETFFEGVIPPSTFVIIFIIIIFVSLILNLHTRHGFVLFLVVLLVLFIFVINSLIS